MGGLARAIVEACRPGALTNRHAASKETFGGVRDLCNGPRHRVSSEQGVAVIIFCRDVRKAFARGPWGRALCRWGLGRVFSQAISYQTPPAFALSRMLTSRGKADHPVITGVRSPVGILDRPLDEEDGHQ